MQQMMVRFHVECADCGNELESTLVRVDGVNRVLRVVPCGVCGKAEDDKSDKEA